MNVLVAVCAVGAEKVVGNEIKRLGYALDPSSPSLAGRVFFLGDDGALFRANLCLRTADRVYLRVAAFRAEDFGALFDGVRAVPWQDFLRKDSRVVVDKVRAHKSALNSERAVQSVVQKAIYTKLGESWGIATLPESGGRVDVRVYIDSDEAQVLLDLSGAPLHRRGYRTDGGIAPLRETTAAAVLQLMLWRRRSPLHDPFCGSGTFAVEAALYAHDVAPGFGRRFGVEELPFFDRARADEIRREEAAKIRTDVECRITGTDIDPAAVARAKLNAEHAMVTAGRALREIGVSAHIPRPDFDVSDFREIAAPYPEGVLVANPPYGERLGDEMKAEEIYRDMARLFGDFPGWRLGVITSVQSFQQCVGRLANAVRPLRAGNLETTLYVYDGTESPKSPMGDNRRGKRGRNSDGRESVGGRAEFRRGEGERRSSEGRGRNPDGRESVGGRAEFRRGEGERRSSEGRGRNSDGRESVGGRAEFRRGEGGRSGFRRDSVGKPGFSRPDFKRPDFKKSDFKKSDFKKSGGRFGDDDSTAEDEF